jgi:WhiB family redox-sensing transcriptional regulator
MSWRDFAACRNEEPDLFFPIGSSGPALSQLARAKTVCRGCPVVSKCLAWALDTGQMAGVWGGLSEDERRRFRQGSSAGVVFATNRVDLLVRRPSTAVRKSGLGSDPSRAVDHKSPR